MIVGNGRNLADVQSRTLPVSAAGDSLRLVIFHRGFAHAAR
ncbi:hypothetical protein SAMCCGM7_pC2168 (plasmid) [Sinorhizobium americanum CCGM7]|nr:hypothetical protein SAMCCGM7_pC2168 [Sinorhizobium americanum CCGM7]